MFYLQWGSNLGLQIGTKKLKTKNKKVLPPVGIEPWLSDSYQKAKNGMQKSFARPGVEPRTLGTIILPLFQKKFIRVLPVSKCPVSKCLVSRCLVSSSRGFEMPGFEMSRSHFRSKTVVGLFCLSHAPPVNFTPISLGCFKNPPKNYFKLTLFRSFRSMNFEKSEK